MNDIPEDEPMEGPASEDLSASRPAPGLPESRPGRVPKAPPTSPESRIQGGSIRIFRVAGIDVFLHWSWFLFAVLSLQSSHSDGAFEFAHHEAQVWYLIDYLALFGMVLLHEFGHVLACRSVGGIANRIVLWPLGGIALVDPPPRPGAWLWSIAAGPLVNVLLIAPTIGFWMVCRSAGCQETAPELYQFATGLAWTNAELLLFNMLPIVPLDGGRILQALLWFVMSRARSLLATAAVGLLTALGLLSYAIARGSMWWGTLAGFGLLFSLVGVQSARSLVRMLDGPRRKEAACPACGAAPPQANFCFCLHCRAQFDVFASGGNCPNCGTALAAVGCPECGRGRAYREWYPEGSSLEPLGMERKPVLAGADPGAPLPSGSVRPPTVAERLVWGTILAACALCFCGLPNADKQPLGLIVWTAGGAILGATSAGALSRQWRTRQARGNLNGTWSLVEENGQTISADLEVPRRLVLNGLIYEEKRGLQSVARGACRTDPLAEPPAISFTPKTGPDAGKPRQGIYRLEGQTLTVCLAYPDHPRPTALQIQPDVQQVRVYRCPDKGESRTPTWLQRVVWGTFFAACALCLCGLPNADKQPLGLILWTAGGAILGAVNAGSMTRAWRRFLADLHRPIGWRRKEEDSPLP